jgi:hypothetical protein
MLESITRGPAIRGRGAVRGWGLTLPVAQHKVDANGTQTKRPGCRQPRATRARWGEKAARKEAECSYALPRYEAAM